jgi:hypothetical protein
VVPSIGLTGETNKPAGAHPLEKCGLGLVVPRFLSID